MARPISPETHASRGLERHGDERVAAAGARADVQNRPFKPILLFGAAVLLVIAGFVVVANFILGALFGVVALVFLAAALFMKRRATSARRD